MCHKYFIVNSLNFKAGLVEGFFSDVVEIRRRSGFEKRDACKPEEVLTNRRYFFHDWDLQMLNLVF